MFAYKSDRTKLTGKRDDILNLILFVLSVSGVVIILLHGKQSEKHSVTGTIIFVASFYFILYVFLLQFRREVLQVSRKTFFILAVIFTFILITKATADHSRGTLIYLIPIAIIPVVIRTFYDARLALFILLITIMLSGFIVPEPFKFILLSFSSGMMSIFTLTNSYKRSILVFTSLMVVVTYSVVFTGMILMENGFTGKILLSNMLLFTGNGILVLLSYPVILLFEKSFLFLSDVTMMELTDTSHPLLRKLAEEAPGSFQHSLQVANLAEEAARGIGANLLLVKVGSLYHDIGKIANPKYFIENQADEVNPHDMIDPLASSRIIINHVKNGVVLAKNYLIPVQIIDFIRTHHGTTAAYFFYKKFTDLHPDRQDLRKEFVYPGPKPFSKETAIVMMADAVEASSRTLGKYSEEEIGELVERIIYLQEQDGQFSDVPLTYREISEIKSVFRRMLINIYHARITYPGRS